MRHRSPRRTSRRPALLAPLLLVAAVACGPPDPFTPEAGYDYYCGRCHGDDGAGDPRAVDLNPKLDLLESEMVLRGDRELVRERIVEGKGAMPGFEEKLTPEQVEALVGYTFRLAAGSDGSSEASAP